MEVYVLDSLLRRTAVVDVYESLIWTERYFGWGDFQLDINSTPAARRLFTAGTQLAVNNSYRVMTVESVENSTDATGKATLILKGRSLESTLDSRVVKNTLSSLSTEPNWVITDTPKNVMNTMFDHIVRNGALSASDTIPYLQAGSIFPVDTNVLPMDPITWTQPPDSLYNGLTKIGNLYGLGFRLVRNFDQSQLYFDVYAGSDRTSDQTALEPVIFSPNLENVQNTTELMSIDKAKNVAYVFSSQGFLIVYSSTADATTAGFDRNVLMVNATDLPATPAPTSTDITNHLTQAGHEALAQNSAYAAFDGEISQFSAYKYGTHYNLGDMVEMRNTDGISNKMRVTEQIFVNDKSGERQYPTLTTYQYVNVGSWLAWKNNQVWADLDADTTTVWGTQP